MRKFIIHIFYWLRYYDAESSIVRKEDPNYKGSKSTALVGLAVLQFANCLTFLAIIQLYTHFNASDIFFSLLPEMPKKKNIEGYLWGALVATPFMALSYFIIYQNTTQEQIDEYFESLSKKQLLRSKIMFFVYIILSFASAIFFLEMKNEQNRENKKVQYGTYR